MWKTFHTASQDLTAPIANLSGLIELLREELKNLLADSQNDYLNLMQQSIVKLQSTIFDLTRMIQVESEKDLKTHPLVFEYVFDGIISDLSLYIKEVVQLLQRISRLKV